MARDSVVSERRLIARARAASISMFEGQPPPSLRDGRMRAVRGGQLSEHGDAYKALSAMYGIELRDPLADRRLVEWCLGVPERQYRRDGEKRFLMERLMRGVLPDTVIDKPHAAGLQVSDWHTRMSRDRDRLEQELATFAADGDISRLMQVEALTDLVRAWPDETPISQDDDRRYLLPTNLPAAIQAGRFALKLKGSNY